MLRRVSNFPGREIHATDGGIGSVRQFYFDDEAWAIRYLVVDTGKWLIGRHVLISPISLGKTEWDAGVFNVSLTKDQIEHSPDIDTEKPVSRQHEADYLDYYGYPYYWYGGGLWGPRAYPAELGMGFPVRAGIATGDRQSVAKSQGTSAKDQGDPHLRSTKEVIGYYIQAQDGDIGHVEDFIIDDETWQIRYIVVDTVNWWPGKKVLVSPQWIERLDWAQSKVYVDLRRETIKSAPEFDRSAPISREYEARLYRHYGRPGYWDLKSKGESV